MRGLQVVAVAVVVSAVPASADPPASSPSAACQRAAQSLTKLIGASDRVQTVISRRCERDRWSRDARACFTAATTASDSYQCVDKLSKEQRTQLEGDADRLNDAKLTQWLARRVLLARPLPPPTITLVALDASADPIKSRALRNQGMSTYQAGRYDAAVRKFSAALDTGATPELIYYAAQAYRMKGQRTKAIELYEKYLEVSPNGAAANNCRAELEKLRDVPQ